MRLITSILIAASACSYGCQTPVEKAISLKNDIGEQTSIIYQSASNAQIKITQADAKVVAATTQPGNPPITNTLLKGAHNDLTGASKALEPIAPAVDIVVDKTAEAAKLTQKAVEDLRAERDHWIGYKTRKLLFWIIAGWLVFGVAGAALTAYCSPVGWAYTIGKAIIRFIPFANPFDFVRKLMGGDSTLKTSEKVAQTPVTEGTPVVVNVNTK